MSSYNIQIPKELECGDQFWIQGERKVEQSVTDSYDVVDADRERNSLSRRGDAAYNGSSLLEWHNNTLRRVHTSDLHNIPEGALLSDWSNN